MELSKEAQAYINHCYKDGIPVTCKPQINEKYELNGVTVKFTPEVYIEIEQSNHVKIKMVGEKIAMLQGIEGLKDEQP
jgi:hypothetical protein